MKKISMMLVLIFGLSMLTGGCATSTRSDDDSMIYKVVSPEPDWIRNGEPIEFEGELWYPLDTVDILTDSEMLPLGQYRDIQFYLQKIDVRPYDRLYTKFGKNKFRAFEVKTQNDSSHRAF